MKMLPAMLSDKHRLEQILRLDDDLPGIPALTGNYKINKICHLINYCIAGIFQGRNISRICGKIGYVSQIACSYI